MGDNIKFATLARAKVNLSLNILGKRDDGYHELESLVVFADFGDYLELDCSNPLGLSIEGEFGHKIANTENNLILQAAEKFKQYNPGLRLGHFHLKKDIPVAAGLGGGSSDAAAALRLLAKANGISLTEPLLMDIAARLGADVPVCIQSQPRFMSGIGEKLGAELQLPDLFCLLVNPQCAVATANVFKALAASPYQKHDVTDFKCETKVQFITWLKVQKNDLERPAISLKPVIQNVLSALSLTDAPQLVRMSGSGATCFALYETWDQVLKAEQILKQQNPTWWIKSSTLNSVKTD